MAKNTNFLNTKQVSKLLEVHVRTVQRLTKQGRLKGLRIGKLLKYRKEDIEGYFSCQELKERRSYPRINSNFICGYSINLLPFKSVNNTGIIRNMSAGGALLYIKRDEINKIDLDDPVDLSFNIGSYLEDVYAQGKVVRKSENGLGIRFREFDKDTRNKINKYTE